MINLELGRLDLTKIPAENHSAALESQIMSLTNQLNIVLQSIGAEDVTLSDGTSLQDFLSKQTT